MEVAKCTSKYSSKVLQTFTAVQYLKYLMPNYISGFELFSCSSLTDISFIVIINDQISSFGLK